MEWNRMYNLALQANSGSAKAREQINEARKHFIFAEHLSLRAFGLGDASTRWRVSPNIEGVANADDGTVSFRVTPEYQKYDIAFLRVEGEVTCNSLATTPFKGNSKRWLAATDAWPAQNPAFQKLVRELTMEKTSDESKLQSILDWFARGQIKYGGAETGSRYGAEKVLQQGFGRCWDLSDVMITLCRASKLPCRQVFGWLHGSEGHVWVEVLIDQQWHQVDPTTGIGCGSDYVPFAVSNDGQPPLIYLSQIELEPVQ
jgi:transglutaminase-like putative cysteine protease